MNILDLLLTLLYPPRCAGCARELRAARRAGLCRACHARLGAVGPACPRCGEPGVGVLCKPCTTTPPPFGTARACFLYRDGELGSSLVQRWKYHRDHVIGWSLGTVLAEHRRQHAKCYDVIVPVPLHASRLAHRGFNQAAVLARAARRPGEALALDALRRVSGTTSQATLGRRARAGNVHHAFAVTKPHVVHGRAVLLIDDVLTTGATVRACASALRAAGAAAVDVWTLARTPRVRRHAASSAAMEGR